MTGMGPLSRAGALLSACALAAILWIASPAAAAVRLGSAPAVPADAHTVGALAASTPMRVTVTLQSQDPAGLAAFANEVSTPGSPLYRDYITPAEFAQRFGATPGHGAGGRGLAPGPRPHAGHGQPQLALDSGDRDRRRAVAGVLDLVLAGRASPRGTTAIVNQQAPSLDSTIAPDVQAVIGLNTLSPAKPLLVQPHAAAGPLAPGAPPGPTSSPADLSRAPQPRRRPARAGTRPTRSLPPTGTPGSTRPATRVRGRPSRSSSLSLRPQRHPGVRGSATASTRCSTNDRRSTAGPERRARLRRGRARHRERDRAGAESQHRGLRGSELRQRSVRHDERDHQPARGAGGDHLVGTVRAGRGLPARPDAENTLFQEAAAQGMSVLSASGDDGSEDCDGTGGAPQDALEVDDPASQPYVTGVGGTSLSARRRAAPAWARPCGTTDSRPAPAAAASRPSGRCPATSPRRRRSCTSSTPTPRARRATLRRATAARCPTCPRTETRKRVT